MQDKNHLAGIGLILVSAAAFGAMAIFAAFAYEASGIGTQSLLFFRFFIAAIVMLPIVLFPKRHFPKGKDLAVLIAMGMIGYAGQSFCFFTALTLIPPSLVAVLLYLYPVFVAVLSIFFLNEPFTRYKFIALCLAICGTVLVVGIAAGDSVKGVVLAVSAAFIYSFYTIAGARVMGKNDPLCASFVVVTSAGLVYFVYNLKAGFFIPQPGVAWLYIVAIAVVSTVVAIFTYFYGIKLSGAVNASMLSTFEPVTTMVLAAVFLGHHIGGLQIAGTALILSSALIVTLHPPCEIKRI